MKNLSIILTLFIAISSCNGNDQNKLKRYEIKSGIVHYKTTISGKIMGSTIAGSGTENLYFKDWGAIELKEEESSQTTTMKFFGKKKVETENTHVINKLDNGESYSVNFETEEIHVRRDPMMDMMKQSDTDVGKAGQNMLKAMGGEKIGIEDFLGYNCEIWDINGAKQWIYKGVVLKMDMTLMGIKTIHEATNAKFNISVSDSHFKLPDFKIVKEESFLNNTEFEGEIEDMDKNMEMVSKLSYEEWKKMATANDEEMQNMSEEELRQTYDMIQRMAKIMK